MTLSIFEPSTICINMRLLLGKISKIIFLNLFQRVKNALESLLKMESDKVQSRQQEKIQDKRQDKRQSRGTVRG